MSAYEYGHDEIASVTVNSTGGIDGTTTDSSRAANADAAETERTIEDAPSPIDGSGYTDHAFG